MAFKLKENEFAAEGIKRIFYEQTSRAISDLMYLGDNPDEKIHDARKCFKKIRALLRLVRNEIGDEKYTSENICFRDAGRQLSGSRNSTVLINAFETLLDNITDQINVQLIDKIRRELNEFYQRQTEASNENLAAEVAPLIHSARKRLESLNLDNCNYKSIKKGFEKIYKKGYNQSLKVHNEPTDENLHELRKRTKYLWYALRLFKETDSETISRLVKITHELSDNLGEDHDLVELKKFVQSISDKAVNDKNLTDILTAIQEKRKTLISVSYKLSKNIYAEKPADFINKIDYILTESSVKFTG